jgi:acetyltransferase
MSIRNLQYLFNPASVALIGASERAGSVGATVLRNLLAGGFQGAIYPVNPRHAQVAGQRCWANVAALPAAPELAVICTPPASVPGLVRELARRGTRAAIILTAGLGAPYGRDGLTVRQAALDAARPSLMRILGPNCLGLLVPGIGLNASFAHIGATPGRIAFVSQSGALVTAILDWAAARGIGFSKFISLGEGADVDFGDILDYLARDPDTDAILMYMEDVHHARKFMSAARAAARCKPTLVLKAGRMPEGAAAAASHTGALAGADAVYDAAIRRAGMLRVFTTEALFDAAETLTRAPRLAGERLAILTNGGGPGVLAADALAAAGGHVAKLAPATVALLDTLLPATWSHANPVDIIGDAPAERYPAALAALLADPGVDAVLMIHAPTAIVPAAAIAAALLPVAAASTRNVLTCWMGGPAVAAARAQCASAGVASFDTPEAAVAAFLQMADYRRNQELLMEVPSAMALATPDRDGARAVLRAALDDGRAMLSEAEAKAVLAAYAIPIAATALAADIDAALAAAARIGYPVAIKIASPDISHKSDVGGVALDLPGPEALRAAATHMLAQVAALRPQARLQGFTVQTMVRRPDAQELIVGIASDPVFGPVVLFGQGGVAVEVNPDRAVGLPPLNRVLARELVARTRVARLLAGFRNRPAADMDAICATLQKVAQMAADLPELAELDINPLLADADGVIALDARIRLAPVAAAGRAPDHLAIRPYPQQLERVVQWRREPLLLRPIRPEDGAAHLALFAALTPEDIRMRLFAPQKALTPSQLARFTQIDYDREMAFIATRAGADGAPETLAVARAVADPDNLCAEFAVLVRSDLKGAGLGRLLMTELIAYCRARGTGAIIGETLSDNHGMQALARALGFTLTRDGDEVRMRLELQ